MSDDNYKWLINYGMTPETISNAFKSDYDPTKDGDYLSKLVEKPKEIDEKKVNRARTMATVGDVMGTLAQMFAAGRGAQVKERDANSLAMSRFSNEEKALRDLYRQETEKYKDRLFSASAADINRSYAQHQSDINAIRDALNRKKEFDHRAEQEAADRKRQDDHFELQNAQFEETKRRNLADERYRKSELAVRSAGSYKGNSGNGSAKSFAIEVAANPSDPDPTVNQFGKKVRVYNLSKDEFDGRLAEAKRLAVSDPSWVDKHRGVLIEKPEMTPIGEMKGSYKFNDRALVEAYVKELYDAQIKANRAHRTFAIGTEGVLKNPDLPVEKKIEWLKYNEKLSDMEIMNVLNERGMNPYSPQIPVLPALESVDVYGKQASISKEDSDKEGNTDKRRGGEY